MDPKDVFAAAGLDSKIFHDPDNVVSFSDRGRLMELCVLKTGCRHFGLLVGQQGGLFSLGLIGYLVQHSANVESALRSLVRYFHLHVQGAVLALTLEDDLAFLSYGIYQPRVEGTRQIEDGAITIAFNILRKLCGSGWKPTEVCFAHREPDDLEPFRQFFSAPLRFDAEQNGLFFPARWLNQSVAEADPELRRLLQKQIDQLEAQHADDFPEQVRRVLHTALLTRHHRADQIAALFSMHSRTMQRRLRVFNISFQELADQSRYEIARQMLGDSEIELSQIAEALGYADASAFARAFRRWSGTAPARWRSEHKHTTAVTAPI